MKLPLLPVLLLATLPACHPPENQSNDNKAANAAFTAHPQPVPGRSHKKEETKTCPNPKWAIFAEAAGREFQTT